MIKWLKSLFKTQKGINLADPVWPRPIVPNKPTPPPPVPKSKGCGVTISDLPISTDIARPLSPSGVTNCGEYIHPGMLRYLCPMMFSVDDVDSLWVIVRDERTQLDYKTRVVDLVKATLTKLEAECHITKQI